MVAGRIEETPASVLGTGKAFTLSLLLVAVVRLACFPFNMENGDAPARVALAIRWLHQPGIMSVKDCSQFGPLPILLNAGILYLWDNPYTAPRTLSLIFGIATVVPLYLLTRLLFGVRSAIFCALFFAFYTLHVKLSITALAEAPFGFFFLTCLCFFYRYRRAGGLGDLISAALFLSVACMIRYEGWVYIPLMALLTVHPQRGGNYHSIMPPMLFAAIASILPLLWMVYNYLAVGDPFWMWRYGITILAAEAARATTIRGTLGQVAYSVIFPGAVIFLSLTPVVALLALVGLTRSLLRREHLTYAALLIPFLVYYVQTLTLRSLPVARYWTLAGLLILPFAGAQMVAWTEGLSRTPVARRTLLVTLSALVMLLTLAAAAYMPKLPYHLKFWSVAPVSPLPPVEAHILHLLKTRLELGHVLLQDSSPWTHVITFNASPNIYENWWGRPAIDKLPSGQDRLRYLEASAPAVLLLDVKENEPSSLLKIGDDEYMEGKIRITNLFHDRNFALYEVVRR